MQKLLKINLLIEVCIKDMCTSIISIIVVMRKIILGIVSILCLVCTTVFAAQEIDRTACVAVMDFGTRPGATPTEININNAEYTSCEYVINRFVDRECFTLRDKELSVK